MMADNPDAPIFDHRYRFETVSDDWDNGRSGFTRLVYDLKLKRLGVMKRAETISKPAVAGLMNEVEVLKRLKGSGVPEVYETGAAIYGSSLYFYIVLEYVEGLRVEKNLDSLNKAERAEILTQLFERLSKAHQMGIVNGDVDLKHLFWRSDKKQLVVIDWGNARLGVDPEKKTEFAYDMARSAEIIFSLMTGRGHPSATGSIALPSDSSLIPEMVPIPAEFRQLCKWAPRTHAEGLRAPYRASELFDISYKWSDAIHDGHPYQLPRPQSKWPRVAGAIFLLAVAGIAFTVFGLPSLKAPVPTDSPTSAPTELTSLRLTSPIISAQTLLDSPTPTATAAPATRTAIASATATPAISPSPGTFTAPILLLDNKYAIDPNKTCWQNTTNIPAGLTGLEGFSRRATDHYWRFGVGKNRTTKEYVQTDFDQPCLNASAVKGIGMDLSVLRLEAKREFGFFLEDSNGDRREYTIVVDNINNTHRTYLRVRDKNQTTDYEQLIADLTVDRSSYLHPFYQFSLEIFFEINNHGLDMIYLREGALQIPVVNVEALEPRNMKLIDQAALPTLSHIQKIGLIGYGGETQVALWPLVFYGQ